MGGGDSTMVTAQAEKLRKLLEEKDQKEKELKKKLEETGQKLEEQQRELEQLRVLAGAPVSPIKAAMSATEAAAVAKINEQAQCEEQDARCVFYALDAKQLRDYTGEAMPKHQDLQRDHPSMLVKFEISFADACAGMHVKKVLTVSPLWLPLVAAFG